jgi:hypothetical protein
MNKPGQAEWIKLNKEMGRGHSKVLCAGEMGLKGMRKFVPTRVTAGGNPGW